MLVALALYGLAHVLLLVARSSQAIAAGQARDAALRAATDGVVAEVMDDGLDVLPTALGVRADTTQRFARPPLVVERRMLRLSEESWMVEATARYPHGAAFTSRVLAWVASPSERVRAWPGAVNVLTPGAIDNRGVVSGDSPPFGIVEEASLGPMSIDDLIAHSPESGPSVRPRPLRVGSTCVPDPANWGAPSSPAHPCSSRRIVRARSGDVVVQDGEGQGVLVVDGDLVLASTTFHGVVLVTGEVRLTGDTRVVGRVVALAGFFAEAGTSVTGSAPAARMTLAEAFRNWPPIWPLHPARSLGPW